MSDDYTEAYKRLSAIELKQRFDNLQDLIVAWKDRHDRMAPYILDPEFGQAYLAQLQSWIQECREKQAAIILVMRGEL